MNEEESKWKKWYAIWREASGGKWWIYQYFKLSYQEIKNAQPKKPKIKGEIKDPIDRYEIFKK